MSSNASPTSIKQVYLCCAQQTNYPPASQNTYLIHTVTQRDGRDVDRLFHGELTNMREMVITHIKKPEQRFTVLSAANPLALHALGGTLCDDGTSATWKGQPVTPIDKTPFHDKQLIPALAAHSPHIKFIPR